MLVDNGGDVYTVDAKSFARTYRSCGPPAAFAQHLREVRASLGREGDEAGSIKTKEGESSYERGDYIVYNTRTP